MFKRSQKFQKLDFSNQFKAIVKWKPIENKFRIKIFLCGKETKDIGNLLISTIQPSSLE